jgi:pSer/pThr/pTyr-binding forkhead associated (FHA) protein
MAWGGILRRIGPNQFRDLGSGTITFNNSEGGMRVSLEYLGETFFAGAKIEEPHLREAKLVELTGVYRSAEPNATYRLSVDKGSLMLRNSWNPPIKLVPLAQDEFESQLGTLVFHRDTNGRVSNLSVFTGGVRNILFQKAN